MNYMGNVCEEQDSDVDTEDEDTGGDDSAPVKSAPLKVPVDLQIIILVKCDFQCLVVSEERNGDIGGDN